MDRALLDRVFCCVLRRVPYCVLYCVSYSVLHLASPVWLFAASPHMADPLPHGADRVAFVSEQSCRDCHAAEAELWRGSHHDHAMEAATRKTVRAPFAGEVFEQFGERIRFSMEKGQFIIEIARGAADAQKQRFVVTYTFGFEPLQQYLFEADGGRLQALTVAWDVEGERWFSLYPEEPIAADDALHSTGRYQTWNEMCADCHSTGFSRGRDDLRDTYDTTWAQVDVGCQACHGPGERHVNRARKRSEGGGAWPSGGTGLVVDLGEMSSAEQVETCARCHSRRRAITTHFEHGRPLLDNYVPSTLDEGLYHADGQILDEVYVYGSFVQSRMYAAGVRCSDCHDPHSLDVKAEGNALCGTCHGPTPSPRFPELAAKRYDAREHHHHPPGPGAQCVNCHMPERTYMQIDGRRDHSLKIPRPDLSQEIGTPNACTDCHAGRSATWAAARAKAWWGAPPKGRVDFERVFSRARGGDPASVSELARVAKSPEAPAAVRATAVALASRFGPAGVPVVTDALADPEAWVRVTALSSMDRWPIELRATHAAPLLTDPARAVRFEAARMLAPLQAGGLSEAQTERLALTLSELRAGLASSGGLPGQQLMLAVLAQDSGDLAGAEAAYLRALALDARFTPARLNLAQLESVLERSEEARELLREGLALDSEDVELHYSLGLLEAEAGRLDEAIVHLQAAANNAPDRPRIHYNLGLALQHAGRPEDARRALEAARVADPSSPDAVRALAILAIQQGAWADAERHATELVRISPGDAEARQMLERVRVQSSITR